MTDVIDFIKNLADAEWIITNGGLYLVMLIVFAETGLFVGFFLPGDYLLFITGMIVANSMYPFDHSWSNLLFWNTMIAICAISGNFVGYWFGNKSGPLLFERKDSLLFKKKHLEQARAFYEKRGGSAIVIARFLPIVRTFAPIVAGVVKMDFKKFVRYNFLGAVIWVFSLVSLGFVLGENAFVKEHLDKIVVGIIVVTTFPVLWKIIRFK
ncbi:MAG: DedA family protein [Bacteroidota bacterium]